MFINNINTRKRRIVSFLLLLILFLELSLFNYYVFAKKERISGHSAKDELDPNETVSYHFSNNVQIEITTKNFTELEIEYDKKIENREASINIRNDNPIRFQIKSKQNMNQFGFSKMPKDPKKEGNQLQSNYKCIFRIAANSTIEKVKLRFKKDSQYGLDPLVEYSIAVLEENENSWELIDTEEVNENSNTYLKGSLTDIEADKEYYITIYEVSNISYIIIWTTIILIIVIISLIVIIRKKDYIYYLKTRSTPIEKGAHRLSLDEVLENENRNKIIELILKEPGIHFNELLRKSELAAGNLVWHIDILETYKIIGKRRIGNFITYFPYYQKNPISNLDLKLNKSKLTLEILETIEKEPGIWNSLITKKMKVDHKTIHYHIEKLIDLGLIKVRKEGRKKRIYPNLDSDYFKKDNQKN
ncbi:MAG: winged helix-turn-helix transcriptional regulator [Promethearchaeota archaeon]